MKPRGTIFFHVIGAMPMNPGFLSSSGMAGVAADEADTTTGAGRRGACRRSCSRPPGNLLPNWLGTYERSAGHDGQEGGGHLTPYRICQAQLRSVNERAERRESRKGKVRYSKGRSLGKVSPADECSSENRWSNRNGVAVNIARVAPPSLRSAGQPSVS